MQRPPYSNIPPAHSPPLHHPVPQHVSTVPQLRSPPPPQGTPQSQGYGGYGGQQPQQHGGGYMNPAFGGFMNDSTAQMGFQVGKSAVMAGQEYMEQNFNRYINVSALKHYFNVSNSYVVHKLFLVLFPWRHRPWSRKQAFNPNGAQDSPSVFLPPRDDINSPDMYIPVMAFVTYILLSTLLAGLRGAFHPELLGLTATTAFGVVIFEILGLKLGCYILSISNESQLLDLVAYSGYKFVGIIVTLVVAEIVNGGKGTGGWVGWGVFLYCYFADAFFLLRSLRYVLLPESRPDQSSAPTQTVARAQRSRRTWFLAGYSYVVQLALMWILSRQEGATKVAQKAAG
ncbi:ER to Golgi transport protein-like protein Yif1 [Viridothelium virens]|uniref:Protein YIF1 n=1 Tax=Viridothelium virens TaxID=1048519 RepID=A0A6A6HK76_VIRVR|nr:ER to Golgi transport protein-like protein Yif1 [Viridothelium virens]